MDSCPAWTPPCTHLAASPLPIRSPPSRAAEQPGDGLNATVGGVLRGAGRQELGALLNLASYWGLGLPAAYLLSNKAGWGLQGLWAGLSLCTSVQVRLPCRWRSAWGGGAGCRLSRTHPAFTLCLLLTCTARVPPLPLLNRRL